MRVAAVDATDGSVRWQAPNVRAGTAVDDTGVFTARSAPRWRLWLAYLNPGWAGSD